MLRVNALDEMALASPAIVGDQLLLRTETRPSSIRKQVADEEDSFGSCGSLDRLLPRRPYLFAGGGRCAPAASATRVAPRGRSGSPRTKSPPASRKRTPGLPHARRPAPMCAWQAH